MNTSAKTAPVTAPLCVDLDGTILRGDLLWECVAVLLKQRPWTLLLLPLWLLRGRSYLKRQLAARVALQPEALPYRYEVVQFLREQRQAGRSIILVTAADQSLAAQVAAHLGGIDEVFGSDSSRNLKGRAKAEFLSRTFGERAFDYIGDSAADLPVWKIARSAYVVGDKAMVRRAERAAQVAGVFPAARPTLISWIRSARVHHWSKNVLIFLPVLAAHAATWKPWRDSLVGFFLFGACASGLYLLNDLLDLHADRVHPWKSQRPIAAGEFPVWLGLAQSVVLVAGSLAASLLLNRDFGLVLLGYAVLTVLYSSHIKKVALLDVFVLAAFYSVRIWAGALISSTPLSTWMVAFSVFFFLSLAMAKRHSELMHAPDSVRQGTSGRGYRLEDRDLLVVLGVASSFAAVVILCLYAHSPEVVRLYGDAQRLLFLAPLVLYWLSRLWLVSCRGELKEDPVTFAMRDPSSWLLALASVAVLLLSGVRVR